MVVFTVLIHVIIVLSLIGLALFTLNLILKPEDSQESTIRTLSVALAFLLYYSTKAFDITISELIINSFESTRPVIWIVSNAVGHAVFGVITAYYIKRIFSNRNTIAPRIIIMLSMLTLLYLSDVYITTYGVDVSMKLLPNISFVIGLSLTIILTYRNES